MTAIRIREIETPAGPLFLGSFENQLCLCDWKQRKSRERIDRRLRQQLNAGYETGQCDLLDQCEQQLLEYFAGAREEFDIPLLTLGTSFQKRVWQALLKIPYGQTTSYSELADALGEPKAIRAVANANGANALSIFIPCHRVIGRSGQLTGYAGGLKAKQWLLGLEFRLGNR